MRFARILRIRLRSRFSRAEVDLELDEELQYHLDRQIEANMAAGMNYEAARSKALRSLEGLAQRQEECRDMRGWNLIDGLTKDIRFALRQLRKGPGFTATATFVLALGLCASISIFAFVDAALIKPLPYRDPAGLVAAYETNPMFPRSNLSYYDYVDWKSRNTVFRSLDLYRNNGYTLTTPEGAQSARGVRITDGFFRTLGVAPLFGRDFREGEDLASAQRVVLLSYSTWQQRYGGSRDVLGKVVVLSGDANVIVGVLPKDFHFAPAGDAEYWVAYHPSEACDLRRSCHGSYGVARLKDGISIQTANANVVSIAKQLEREHPDSNRDQGATLVPLTEALVGDVRPILLILLGGAGLLLLIAGVNVAGLLVVRSEGRKREIAVRTALGASAGRLLCQFLSEAVVLATAGGALGLAISCWAIRLLQSLISADMMARTPFLRDLGLNARTAGLAAILAALSIALLALPPALRIWSSEVRSGLAEASRGSAGTVWRRLGSKLVVVELATAMVLLAGAGLLGKSLYLLLHVNVGIEPDHLVTIDVAAPPSYHADPQALALARQIIARTEALPGVTSVGVAVNGVPLSGNGNTTWFHVQGRPWHGEHNDVPERDVSPNYFTTLGATLRRGRYFTDSDDAARPRVAIVNQAFVRRFFPGEEAIGRQLVENSTPEAISEIVGVVDDIREGPLDADIPPVLYLPFNQTPDTYFSLVVRTVQAEGALLPTLAASIHQFDSGVVAARGATMAERIDNSQSAYVHRSLAWLVGGFAALALLLGVVGLYGVIAYSVNQRSREIGIRVALGAQPQAVYRLILFEAAWLIAAGIGLGLVGSLGAASLMRGMLFGVHSGDGPTLATVAAVLATAALLASFIPARRAASLNPVESLRSE